MNETGLRSGNDIDLEYSHTFIYSISYLPSFRSQTAIISEKYIVFTFSCRKALVTKFGIVVKLVKVNPGSELEQTMMYQSPQCYIPSFVKFGPLVLEKKMFEGFLPYMGVATILFM